MIKLKMIPVGLLGANCYLLCNEETKEAVLIDPGADYPRIKRQLDIDAMSVKAVLLTHGHFDHCNAVSEFKKDGAKVYIHGADKILLETDLNMSSLTGEVFRSFVPDVLVSDGDIITECGITFSVLHTPGHTAGSVCYLVGDGIFTGDTLFCMGVGRTDMPTGDAHALENSVRNVLFALNGDYKIYPGHGETTTLEFERRNNPYV